MALSKKVGAILAAITIAAALIVTFALPAFADSHPTLDLTKKGSITMTHKATDTGEPIEGSTMVAYKVADAVYEDGNAVFEPVEGLDSDNIKNAMNALTEEDKGAFELAAKLEKTLGYADVDGTAMVTDSDGIAKWTDLSVGLYLIVNEDPAEGYEAIPSFVISVPRMIDGEYVYDVNTIPKPAPAKESDDEEEEEEEKDEKLPQTGQLWWPVPVLAGVGLLLIGVGAYRRKRA